MAYEPEDRDMAVIGGPEDVPLQFEGDDLQLPASADDYDFGKSPTAKHTDFDTSKGAQTVDGVKFDLGPILKGATDAVTATAKAVAEVSKAQAAADNKKPPSEPTPKETTPKEDKTKPSSSPSAPVAKASGSTGAYVAVGGGVVVVAFLVAVLSSKKRKGRAL